MGFGTKTRAPARLRALLLVLFLALLLALAVKPLPACGQAPGEALEEELDLSVLDRLWQELEDEMGGYLPSFHWRDILGWMESREEPVGLGGLLAGFWQYFWKEVLINLNLLGKLLALAVVAALLKNLQRAFSSENLAPLAQAVIFLVLISIAITSFNVAIGIGREAITRMVDIVLALLPLLMVLLASLGSLASAAIFHPLVIFTVNFFSTVVMNVVFPLIYLTTVLSIVNHLTDRYPVNRLAGLFRDGAVWVMGVSLTIFIGVTAIQGVAGSVADAVALRTAKFATGALVPVVGGMLADALETVVGVSILLKNGLSLAGLIFLLLFTVFPLIKIFAIMLAYKVAAAVVQPLGETELSEALNTLGNCLALVFAAVAAVCFMFIVAITIIVGAGNAAVMFR
jgi:stage III sporulation protein AE